MVRVCGPTEYKHVVRLVRAAQASSPLIVILTHNKPPEELAQALTAPARASISFA